MKEVIRKILPGLIPLMVFIIADAIWGPQVGVVVALVVGVIELLVVYIRDRVLDRFILLDTAILIMFSSLSLITHDEVFFKLKPAFMESFLLVVLGISIFTSRNLLLMMSRRFMPKNIGVEQEVSMIQMIRPLFWLMVIHVVLIVYSAYFMSNEWWGFISGVLFYVIILAYFAFVLLKNNWMAKRALRDVEFYDANNQMKLIKGKFNTGVIEVRLYLVDEEKSIYYLQQKDATCTSFRGEVNSASDIKTIIPNWIGGDLQLESMDVQSIRRYNKRSDNDKLIFVFLGRITEVQLRKTRIWKGYTLDELSPEVLFDLTKDDRKAESDS
ncbi:septation protein IspZ [Halosquirtibacter xylanolyticus]|uniref:septation protein IspZ n=1 Tax=Halosquirtibacter xylanolyticus TaxID=3374599 RepID=UPI00374A7CAB|nr:septation protein IspZ [Prolixibacteraceae bacterium]